MKYFKALTHIIIVISLTLITQIGGLIWIVVFGSFKYKRSNWNKRKRLLSFSIIYVFCIFFIVPFLAPLNNRKSLINTNKHIESRSIFFILTARNYVHKDLYEELNEVSIEFTKLHKGEKIVHFDASFPFLTGFPLLPHLSHNDGKKIDISFKYKDPIDVTSLNKVPGIIGYGIFEGPEKNEFNQINNCINNGYFQYDYAKIFGWNLNTDLTLDKQKTADLANLITARKRVSKLFIEPHLKQRLNLTSNKVRFHGCRAVRHDDHIHFQIK